MRDEVNPEELANAPLSSIRLFVATGRRARPEDELSAAAPLLERLVEKL